MRVLWTEPARRHVKAIQAFIAPESPMRAQHMVDRITTRAEELSGFPRSGRLVTGLEELEVRELVERPFRII